MDNVEKRIIIFDQIEQIECVPVIKDLDEVSTLNFASISDLSNMGVFLGPIANIAEEIQNKNLSGKTLFKMVLPKDLKGKLKYNKDGFTYGHIVDKKEKIAQRAKFEKVDVLNPTSFLITMAISAITNKLNEIKSIQNSIIDFLYLKEESKIKGNIKLLQEIIEEFKYNYNNDKFKNNKHILVQDIKRESEQSIIFIRQQIINELTKSSFLLTDKKVEHKVKILEEKFEKYRLSGYLFSFSTFLEMMLLENFESGYLKTIYNNIISYNNDYNEIKEQCYSRIKEETKKTIGNVAINSYAETKKFLGKTMSNIPFLKNGSLGQKLIESGDKTNEENEKKINEQMENVLADETKCILAFANNILTINKIFNEDVELLIDSDKIYIK